MSFKICNILLGMTLILAISCSKENIDNTEVEPEVVTTEVEEVEQTTIFECENKMVITSEVFNLDVEASCVLFRTPCSGSLNQDYSFMVFDNTWDFWGTGQATLFDHTDGLPGFAFGNGEVPEMESIIKQYAPGLLINDITYELAFDISEDTEVTIQEVGLAVGEMIGGTIKGNLLDRDNGEAFPFEGTFCVPITEICE